MPTAMRTTRIRENENVRFMCRMPPSCMSFGHETGTSDPRMGDWSLPQNRHTGFIRIADRAQPEKAGFAGSSKGGWASARDYGSTTLQLFVVTFACPFLMQTSVPAPPPPFSVSPPEPATRQSFPLPPFSVSFAPFVASIRLTPLLPLTVEFGTP